MRSLLACVLLFGCSSSVEDKNTDPTTPPAACEATVAGTMPGVSVRVTNPRCDFRLGQASAGLRIEYEVTVASDLPAFYKDTYHKGVSDTPLQLFPSLTGNGQRYCNCDVGLPHSEIEEIRVAAGTYRGVFEWDGRNYGGFSDTAEEEGAAFPAGAYTLKLSTAGTSQKPPSGSDVDPDQTLDITIPITLVP